MKIKRIFLKRGLSVFLAVLMLLSVVPVMGTEGFLGVDAKAASYTSGIFTYTVSDNKVTITDCSDISSNNIVVPSDIYDYPITEIGDYAFDDCTQLKSVTLPGSLTDIGDYAFDSCVLLETVIFNGTFKEWAGVSIGKNNEPLSNAIFSAYQEIVLDNKFNVAGPNLEGSTSSPNEEDKVIDSSSTYSLFNSGRSGSGANQTGVIYEDAKNPAPTTYTNSGYDIYIRANTDNSICSSSSQLGKSFLVENGIVETVQLSILAYDVDESDGETDEIYLVDETAGTSYFVGELSGMNLQWNNTTLDIDASRFTTGHTYYFKVVGKVSTWCVYIRTVSISVMVSGSETDDEIEDASISATIDSTGKVSAELYAISKQSGNYSIEFKATHAKTNNQLGSLFTSMNIASTGTNGAFNFNLESGAPNGIYTIDAYIKETATGNVLKNVSCVASYGDNVAVSYSANGGSNNLPEDTTAYSNGDTVTVLFNKIPTKTDCEFLGWSRSKVAQTPEFTANGSKTFVIGNTDVTLYAVWKEKGVTSCSHVYKYYHNETAHPHYSVYVCKNECGDSFRTIDTNFDPDCPICCGCAYDGPVWNWNGYTSATATFTCTKNSSHVQVIDAKITSQETASDCTGNGQIIYTATVVFNGNTYTDTKTETTLPTGHEYDAPVWNWNGYASATATFTCKKNPAHVVTEAATITSSIFLATCTDSGYVLYTATVVFNGETYTDQKTEITDPPVGHVYVSEYYQQAHPHYKVEVCSCGYENATTITSYNKDCPDCNHEHSYIYAYNLEAHPHNSVYRCSCGDEIISQTENIDTSCIICCPVHDHSYIYAYNQPAHPHYQVYKCTDPTCTNEIVSQREGYLSSCSICNKIPEPVQPPVSGCSHKYEFSYYHSSHPHYAIYECTLCDDKFVGGATYDADCEECNIHVHDYSIYIGTQTDHPHYKVYECSCGKQFVSSIASYDLGCATCNLKPHSHSYVFAYSQGSHPHYSVYRCSCGDEFTSMETNVNSNCAICAVDPIVPPVKTCNHSFVIAYSQSAHPHYLIYRCSTCNAEYISTTTSKDVDCGTCYPTPHVHDFVFAYSQSAHPHYSVYRCLCGEVNISETENYNASCRYCNRFTAVIRTPSTTTINYGESIILHADIDGKLPAGAKVEWEANNNNFGLAVSEDGRTCMITSEKAGYTTITMRVYDSERKILAEDIQEMNSKIGFFQKIIAFFRNLFGITKVIPQAFKSVF